MIRTVMLAAAVFATAAFAGDVSAQQAAQVTRDRAKAMEEINKKYGNKKSSELSADERRQMIKETSEAMNKVYEKNGVTAKDFAKFEATANQDQRSAAAAQGAAMDKKDADDKKAAEAKKGQENSGGVIIEKGIDPKDLQDGKGGKAGRGR